MLISIKGEPPRATAQEKGVDTRGGRPRFYDKPAVRDARRYYRDAAEIAMIGKKTMTGAVRLSVMFGFGTDDKAKQRQLWKTTRPDCDNMVKILKDELTHAGVWKDDAQVAEVKVQKIWVPRENAGTSILIEELETER